MWNSQGQEGQFDVGLVNRWGNVQAGGFASFKYLNYRQYQQGGSLAEGAFLVDYLFKGGRVGVFGTQGFKNTAVLNMQELYPGVYNETYAHIINQYGFDAQVGVWGDAYLQGNIGVLHRYGPGEGSTPGGQLRLVQPIVPKLAFTAEYDYNASLVGTGSMLLFGLQVGNYIKPKEFADVKTPVPMDVPRIRYEFLTRRVGTAPPVADAGPPQIGVAAGIITLNGSGSHDPLGEPLTFSWKQIGGPSVSLSGANTATPTFMAAAGQSYVFQLTVTNTDGLSGSATTSVQTLSATALTISQFYANPATVNVGQSTTLIWVLQGATSASISPGIGAVNANSGSVAVSPAATTTYILTATGASGTVTQSVTVTVGAPGSPQIVRFAADPNTIPAGGSVTLSWPTNNASTVAITPNVGTVTEHSADRYLRGHAAEHLARPIHQALLAGDWLDQYLHRSRCRYQSELQRLRYRQSGYYNYVHLDRYQRRWTNPGQRHGQCRPGSDPDVHGHAAQFHLRRQPRRAFLDHRQRYFGGADRRRPRPDYAAAQRQLYHQPGQQPNLYSDRLWTWRTDRQRYDIGLRQVI